MTVAAVVSINRSKRLALLDSGTVVTIETMLDNDGAETDDPEQCAMAILQLPCGRWACCDLKEFEDSATH